MTFKYNAYNNLLVELGRNDYVVEISELAIRDFLKRIEESSNPSEFVKDKCGEHKLMVSYDKSNNYYNQITLGHIANVYHIAEAYFYELQTEYNSLSNTEWHFVEKVTKLEQVITYFTKKNRFNKIDKIDEYLIDTFNYYQYLRIYFSHKKTTSEKDLENKWQKAVSHFNETIRSKYRVKGAPKQKNYLDFEDFFIFTQITKELAFKISCFCYPDPSELAKSHDITRLKKYGEISERKSRIETYLKTKFGYAKENDTDTLVDEIADSIS